MFGIELAIISAVNEAKAYQREAIEFDKLCKSLPEEIANGLKAERKKRQEIAAQHRRDLEVAREGRPLNFWGNR